VPIVDMLLARFGVERVRIGAPLARYTTWRVGGPADWLLATRSAQETVDALRIAGAAGVPVTLLGGGSNVLIGDHGIRGLVIRPQGGGIELLDQARVRADAAVTINRLVRWTVNRGLAGLESWAGTPGTVGGAMFGNAHFAGRLMGEVVDSVRIAALDGSVHDVPQAEMDFGYDRSRLQRTKEVVLSAVFRVGADDPLRLREVARQSLARRKLTEPLDAVSAGCVFQNPDPSRDPVPKGVPASAGALIDRAGLKGVAIGRARVSAVHANFIVNEGGATARDIRALIDLCRTRVRERFGVELHEEIVQVGEFEPAGAEGS
jgi:UDP-N-acetylmuramate dehydrogenase